MPRDLEDTLASIGMSFDMLRAFVALYRFLPEADLDGAIAECERQVKADVQKSEVRR